MRAVKSIVEGEDGKVVVVVSALGGVTDDLFLTARKAVEGDSGYEEDLARISARHYEQLEQVVCGDMRKMVECTVASLLEELSNILRLSLIPI